MRGSGHSMLVPNTWDVEWTDLTQLPLCDQPPGTPGVGAALMAMQALGLSPEQAAALVTSGQSGSGVSVASLSGALRKTLSATGAAMPSAPIGGRLPIPTTVDPALQLLAGDPGRVFLLIQNNEATGGGTLLISIDPINTATPAYYLNFPPGGNGLLLDENVLGNPIYAGWTGTPAAGGVIFYGSTTPPAPAVSGGGWMGSTRSPGGAAGPTAGF